MRAAVAVLLDDDGGLRLGEEEAPDAEELADTVLALVRDAGREPGDEPWHGARSRCPTRTVSRRPPVSCVSRQPLRPGHRARTNWPPCDATWPSDGGSGPLAACGVLAGFALVRATDVVLDPDELEPREGDFAEPDDAGCWTPWTWWCEDILDRSPDSPVPPVATELVAVRRSGSGRTTTTGPRRCHCWPDRRCGTP
ncbi:hypothetical protein GCM10017687_49500 [Streptomyces echinatus]